MDRLRVVRIDTRNGDTHFVMLEPQLRRKPRDAKYLDESEIRIASKKEASKPLILVRTE